jgi:predicted nucleotidyltransferase
MTSAHNHIIDEVKTTLLKIDEKAEVILFGSRARGNQRSDSDWDFLFLTSLKVNLALRKRIADNLLPIELEANAAIQVIPKNKTEWEMRYAITPLYKNIKAEGITL